MLPWLQEYLDQQFKDSFFDKAANVLQYVTFRSIVGAFAALVLTLLIGPKIIRKLLSLKMGQPIRTEAEVRDLYALHEHKKNTPTMGGLMILGSYFVVSLLFSKFWNPMVATVLLVTLLYAMLGFRDDYLKVAKKNSKGVSSRGKLVVQFGAAIVAAIGIYYTDPDTYGQLWVPFVKKAVVKDMGVIPAVAFYAIIIAGTSNAVNITDGLDGLAAGVTVPVLLALAVFAYLGADARAASLLIPHTKHSGEVAVLAMCLLGACLGFLWFNCAPARVFMGDTGSLAIGGSIGVMAICSKQELTLLLVGLVYVVEALSVLIQVGYFKYTRKRYGVGRRFFRMAPLHHHFELSEEGAGRGSGLKETQIVTRAWIISLVCALLGIATLKLR
jgi:phospho-N-acetylmuramoyl-pentapeptide-transferase